MNVFIVGGIALVVGFAGGAVCTRMFYAKLIAIAKEAVGKL